jgi:CMP-N,N'-diacetyllegionaminic acid synthase
MLVFYQARRKKLSKSKNILGVILARGNSKGIKKKNLLKLNGRTLIDIAIDNALKSKKLSKIVFSSEDDALIKIAQKKIKVHFKRPKKLSADDSSSYSVIKHAIKWLQVNESWSTDIVVILSPTTPFRTAKHIDAVLDLMIKKNYDASMTITDPDYPPYWMFKKENNRYKFILPKGKNITRRQDAPKVYQPAGMAYAMKNNFLGKIKGILPQGKTAGYFVNREEAMNIDTITQYQTAKFLAKKHLKNK